jgi:hypothetical protein
MTTIAYASVGRDGMTFATQPLLVESNARDLRRLADAVHSAGAAISIQLTHAGACVCVCVCVFACVCVCLRMCVSVSPFDFRCGVAQHSV